MGIDTSLIKDKDLLSKKDFYFDPNRIYIYDLREDSDKKNLIVKFIRHSRFHIGNKGGNLRFVLKRYFHGSFLCEDYKIASGMSYNAPLKEINPEKTEIISAEYDKAFFQCEKKFWGGIDVRIYSEAIGEIFFACKEIIFHSYEPLKEKEFEENLEKARNAKSLD